MQAIRTAYHGPTDHRPARMKASCQGGNTIIKYEDGLTLDANHRAACEALMIKLGWTPPYYAPMVGGTWRHDTYWVFLPKGTVLPEVYHKHSVALG